MRPIKPSTLRALLFSLLMFNVLDGFLTLFFLNQKIAEEANPIMDWAFRQSVFLFVGIKIVWIGFNLILLWNSRKSIWINVTWILCAFFACLLCYELVYFVLFLIGK